MSIPDNHAVSTAPPPSEERAVYRATLLQLARHDPRIYCLDTDMGGLESSFGVELPQQYVDLGIAEANLMSVAAALSRVGKIPFANTMAAFASARAYEQVKLDIAYHNLPVRIVATHAGLSAAHFGPTHHALQDIAAMRALPNMTILSPADTLETVKMVEATVDVPGPVYIRLGRRPTPLVYQQQPDFVIGQAVPLRIGHDITIIATGAQPVLAALEAAEQLAQTGIAAAVLNMHTLKPLDVPAIVAAAQCTAAVITVEDHSIIGGLGSAVAETLAEEHPARLYRIGVRDVFCDQVEGHRELLAAFGVSSAHIVAAAYAALGLTPAAPPRFPDFLEREVGD